MNTHVAVSSPPGRTSALVRRMGANSFDAFLLVAVWVAAAAPIAIAFAVAHKLQSPALQILLGAYFPLVGFAYFGRAWVRSGQTFGMRAWRLSLRAARGRLSVTRAAVRYVLALAWWGALIEGFALAFQGDYRIATLPLALFGTAYLWIFFDPEAQALHDRLSGTRVLFIPKSPGAGEKPRADQGES